MFNEWYQPNCELDFPVGGSQGMVDALVAGLRKHGGALKLGAHVEEILVEKRNEKRPEQVKGRNRQGCPVFFAGDIDELKGKLVPVRIVEAKAYSLVGELEDNRFVGGRYDADEAGGEVLDV